MKKVVPLTFVFCLLAAALQAENLLRDGGLESAGTPGSPWSMSPGCTVSTEVRHGGAQAVRMSSDVPRSVGLCQVLTFDPPLEMPVRVGGWAWVDPQNAVRTEDRLPADFNIYIDAFYTDGTPLWGKKAAWDPAKTGWQYAETTIFPEKPLQKIEVYVFLRNMVGAAVYDDICVEPVPLEVRNLRTLGGVSGHGSFFISGNLTWDTGVWKDGLELELQQVAEDGTARKVTDADGVLTGSRFLWTRQATGDPTPPQTFRIISSRHGTAVSSTDFTLDTRAAHPEKPILVWTESPMRRIFLHTFPENVPDAPEYGLALARNEAESFQIAALASRDFERVSITFSDLTSEGDENQKIARENLDWKQVGYVPADELVPHSQDSEGIPGYWPDTLLPLAEGRLWKNRTMAFWVTLFVPEGTAPGVYRGTVTLTPEGADPVQVALRAEVWDLPLPSESHLDSAFALMDGFLELSYGHVTPELRRPFGEMMLRNRLSPEGDISRTEFPNLDALEAYRGRGLGKISVLNLVLPRGNRPWRLNEPPEFYTPERCEQFLEQLRPYVEELRKRGLAQQAYVYTFDERGKEYHPAMTRFFGMIHENFPELATFTTAYIGTDLELLRKLNVDWTCPVTSSYNYAEAEACRKAGMRVWSYICCGPGEPYANIMLHNPLIETRVLGWQAFEQKYDGLLYWGVNIWSYGEHDPLVLSDPEKAVFANFATSWRFQNRRIYGDGLLLYPGEGGVPVGSIRLANLRDAFEDYELLHMLAEQLGSVDAARAFCAPVSISPTEFTRDPSVLDAQRRRLVEALGRSGK